MQSESKIRHRIKLLRFRYMEKEIRKSTSRLPHNCKFNAAVRSGKDVVTHVCIFQNPEFRGVVCDSRYSGDALAARCPYFEPLITAEEAKKNFDEFWVNASLAEFASAYPDAMALLWVLGEKDNRDLPAVPFTETEISVDSPQKQEDLPLNLVLLLPTVNKDYFWSPFNGLSESFSGEFSEESK